VEAQEISLNEFSEPFILHVPAFAWAVRVLDAE
jgi:hypothetical protein